MFHTCELCKRKFDSLRELNIHRGSCKRKKLMYIRRANVSINDSRSTYDDEKIETTSALLEANVLQSEHENVIQPHLPSFTTAVNLTPDLNINGIQGDVYETQTNNAYNEIIKWRKNIFMLLSGKAGKALICKLSYWLDQFNGDTKLKPVSVTTFMVLPSLLLQKPSRQSKAKEHAAKLDGCLQLWREENITSLLNEGRTIQKRLGNSKMRTEADVSRIFAKLMMEGKVSAAIKFLSENNDSGVLPADDETIRELQAKHPSPATIQPGSLLQGLLNQLQDSYFDNINEDIIRIAAKQTRGAAGPSKMDADQFRNILVNKKFKHEGKELREQIATLTRYHSYRPKYNRCSCRM